MAYRVFISYSTKDLDVVNRFQDLLKNPEIEVFIAEYSVSPGEELNDTIIDAIDDCQLFALFWSRNSKMSDYVQPEIGVARALDKTILPIVLDRGLELPGFISELKYLKAYGDPTKALIFLQKEIFARAGKHQKSRMLIWLGLALAIGWLFTRE